MLDRPNKKTRGTQLPLISVEQNDAPKASNEGFLPDQLHDPENFRPDGTVRTYIKNRDSMMLDPCPPGSPAEKLFFGTATEPPSIGTTGSASSDDFDWRNDPDIVLKEQPATAIYFNTKNDLVIRQKAAWDEERDTIVIVTEANAQGFLDSLCNKLGIASAGGS